MPPRADERIALIEDKSDGYSNSTDGRFVHQGGVDSEYDESKNPHTLRRFRTVVMWAMAIAVLVSMLSICTHPVHHKKITEKNNDRIASLTEAKKSTNSKYKRVQGIGFQIYTGGAPAFVNHTDGTNSLNPECVGRESYGQVVGEIAPMIQCYIGLPDPMLDVRGRIEIMMDAVEKAYALADNDDPETLKVFIAPEFYWRGITGAYSFQYDELPDDPSFCGPICQILMGLEALVANERFENWIFLFGTIIASDTLPTEDPYDFLFYNFAPLYKGYDPAKMDFQGKRFLVPKRYVSSSDFLTPQRHLNESSFKQLLGQPPGDSTVYNPHDFNQKRYDPTMWKKYKDELGALGYTMIEYDWLMIDGLSITTEICFDHQMRTALNTYLGDVVTGRQTLIPSSSDEGLSYVSIPQYQAQISIVSSAGMTVTPDSLALTNGGTIFLQDGLTNATNQMVWSDEGCEQGLQFEGGTQAAQRRAFLSPTDIVLDHKALMHFERHDLYEHWHSALEGAFSAKVYPPQITIFEAVDIAEVSP